MISSSHLLFHFFLISYLLLPLLPLLLLDVLRLVLPKELLPQNLVQLIEELLLCPVEGSLHGLQGLRSVLVVHEKTVIELERIVAGVLNQSKKGLVTLGVDLSGLQLNYFVLAGGAGGIDGNYRGQPSANAGVRRNDKTLCVCARLPSCRRAFCRRYE